MPTTVGARCSLSALSGAAGAAGVGARRRYARGRRGSRHSAASLAFSPPRTVDTVIIHGLKGYTRHTLTSPEDLHRVLARSASRAWRCPGGGCAGAVAIAAPVFAAGGGIVCAIEIKVAELAAPCPGWSPPCESPRSLSRDFAASAPAASASATDATSVHVAVIASHG